MAKSTFRATTWDPILIISQIVTLQSLCYLSASLIILIVDGLTGADITLDNLLNFREYRGDTIFGWTLTAGWLANSVFGVFLLLHIVERAKLCLDFTITFHFFHFLFTSMYSQQIPSYFMWWALNVVSCCLMSIGGEWMCMRKEMAPIQLGGGSSSEASSSRTKDDRKRRKTSSPTYEMVPLEEVAEDRRSGN
ncbi:hypothetical protein K493DRAFT_286975 [Basidiobolus meristosporus CBS 931.73]|uniref:Integral membrane protein S linking to the trans Golgi network-domain-containing protein n=1 Tax=Basidiobolus meristosporus CBS 931.73 TaxID=1314790 RepID=A0A1Y1XZX1_9FUNG|nr:hypothetical protein K493DRAFT_286975 [Basidiobolus meristosporus CBS 931.73]|eukprot:ORX91292.1 hypothetical protein K493DRAFT_286975 [Basidiobolus meristosporus CBS 931.73]